MRSRPTDDEDGLDLASLVEVTAQMSEIIADGGMRQPDLIRRGPESYELSFIWEDERLITVIDLREGVESA